MIATIERKRPAIIRRGRNLSVAILISVLASGCGGGGESGSFRLTVDVAMPGETILDWSPHPESNTYQIFRDGQQIIRTVGDIVYTDRGLLAGARYCYSILALELPGNVVASSNEVCVTMPNIGSAKSGAVGEGSGANITVDSYGVPRAG